MLVADGTRQEKPEVTDRFERGASAPVRCTHQQPVLTGKEVGRKKPNTKKFDGIVFLINGLLPHPLRTILACTLCNITYGFKSSPIEIMIWIRSVVNVAINVRAP